MVFKLTHKKTYSEQHLFTTCVRWT